MSTHATQLPVPPADDPVPATGRRGWPRRVRASLVLGFAVVLLTLWVARVGLEAYLTPGPPPERLGAIAVGAKPQGPHIAVRGEFVENWPNLHGPTHDGLAGGEPGRVVAWDETGPRELWRVPCGTGYSSPVVWDDRLILLHRVGDEEIVSSLDVADGRVDWEYRYPTSFVCGTYYTDGPYGTPATDGERVYTLGAEGRLHALDLASGAVVWEHDLRDEFDVETGLFGMGHSPLVWGELVILNVGGRVPRSGIVAFDRRTGDVRWRATDHGPSYATPQPARIHGIDYVFVLTAEGLVSLDPSTGDVHWSLPFQSKLVDGYTAVTPVVHADLVLISVYGRGETVLRILPDGSHEQVWESTRTLTSHYTPIVSRGGLVYGMHTLDKSLRCVDLATGEVRWRWRSPLKSSTQIGIGDRLLLQGEHGRLGLVSMNPEAFEELAMTEQSLFPEENLYGTPAFSRGRLFLRSEKEAVCVELQFE